MEIRSSVTDLFGSWNWDCLSTWIKNQQSDPKLTIFRDRGARQELRRHISLRLGPGPGLQADVRAVRSDDSHVLLPQQTHDVRFRVSYFISHRTDLLRIRIFTVKCAKLGWCFFWVYFSTGNNNKLNWVLEDKQELIDIIETIYRGAKKGRGIVVSPKGEAGPYFLPIGRSVFCKIYRVLLMVSFPSCSQIIRLGIAIKFGLCSVKLPEGSQLQIKKVASGYWPDENGDPPRLGAQAIIDDLLSS